MKNLFATVAIIFSILLTSCADDDPPVPSPVVSTSDMYTEIHAFSDDANTLYVEAYLKKGGATSTDYIRLEDGDTLYASKNTSFHNFSLSSGNFFEDLSQATDEHHLMKEVSHSYDASLPIPFFSFIRDYLTTYGSLGVRYVAVASEFAPGNDLVVSLERPDRLDAPNSRVTLPADFSITEPLAGQSVVYSRSLDDITVRWAPSGTSLPPSIFLVVNCDSGDSGTWDSVPAYDSGSMLIPAGTLSGLIGDCVLRINLTRSQLGQVDPAFGWGGIIKAHQIRFVNVNTVQ